MIAKLVLATLTAILIGVPLYAVPATLSLPPGPRPGIEALTIEQAAQDLIELDKTDWELVEGARTLVAERMQYSRRNSFDSAGRAFERGYGYCTQHAYALTSLLTKLGFEAKVVQAFRNRFPDGEVTAHAWVSVKVNDESRYIDSLFYDEQASELDFTSVSEVLDISPAFKMVAFWGGTAVNAHRYYVSGKDL
ncbi:transglutaminase family protein [Chloroflexota bacterium]